MIYLILEGFKMDFKKLEEAHDKVKNHPFRLDHSDWEGYYNLLWKLDKEFCDILEEKYNKDYSINWGFFIHEVRSAISHFQFEFREERSNGECGRASLSAEEHGEDYGKTFPEYQKKIVIVLENYIQQIHKFITTRGHFEEFITYYMGGDNCYNDIQSNGKSRWSKYKLNKEENKFEWFEKLE